MCWKKSEFLIKYKESKKIKLNSKSKTKTKSAGITESLFTNYIGKQLSVYWIT